MLFVILSVQCLLSVPSGTKVLKALPSSNTIGISAGKREGVEKLDRISVRRDGKEIARGKVILCGKTASLCRVMWRKSGFFPKYGDKVIPLPENEPFKPAEKGQTKGHSKKTGEKPEKPAKSPEKTGQTEIGSASEKVTEEPVKPKKVPPFKPRNEKPLAVGALPRRVFVSTTEGIYTVSGSRVFYDDSTLPHRIFRFVPGENKIWGETSGGALLWKEGKWLKFPWSTHFNIKRPAFSHVTTAKGCAWGSIGRKILFWDLDSTKIDITGGSRRKSQGVWVQVDNEAPEEVEGILARKDLKLLVATASGSIYLLDGNSPRLLGNIPHQSPDPLLLELATDKTGAVWTLSFAADGGLFRLDSKSVKKIPQKEKPQQSELPPGRLLRVLSDDKGTIHVLNAKEGVFSYSSGGWKHVVSGLPERAVDMALQGTDILVLTERRLLVCREETKQELLVLDAGE